MSSSKIMVIDTNVPLHDSTCLDHFEDNDVVIPITVFEELDRFKKGNDSIHFHARHFLRQVDAVSGDKLFNDGISMGKKRGRLQVLFEVEFHKQIEFNLNRSNPDHHILNIAFSIQQKQPHREVILVSKDVNLRMKAKAIGLRSQDYTTDHVSDVDQLYKGYRFIENIEKELIDSLYQEPFEIPLDSLPADTKLHPHEGLILRNHKKSALGIVDSVNKVIRRVDRPNAYGIKPLNAEQTFAMEMLLNDSIQLLSISGKAGTGKTLLALATALEQRKNFRQIVVARPIVALSNKDLGYLPGDVQQKIDPYMKPLYDNLGVIQQQFKETDPSFQRIKKIQDEQKLIIEPLSYIRGRSMVNVLFIIDEAQNLTPHEIKTIITRAGAGTKIVFTGDIFQIDHPYLDSQSNGMSYLIEKMQGQHLYAHISLQKGERSELAELASELL